MRSFLKNIFIFILFISLPCHLMASKSNKNDKESNKSTLVEKNQVNDLKKDIKSHPIASKDINEDNVVDKTTKLVETKTSQKSIVKSEKSSMKSNDKSMPKIQNDITVKNEKTSNQVPDNESMSQKSSRTPVEKVIVKADKSELKNESNSQNKSTKSLKDNSSESKSNATDKKTSNKTPKDDEKSKKSEINHDDEININDKSEIREEKSLPEEKSSQKSEHKNLDNGRSSIISSRSKYEKIGENENEHVCKKNLMSIYSVEGNQLDQAVKSTPMEKAYCRRNNYTCCSAYNINSISKYYGEGKKKLRLKFEVLEELLALFRGPKFIEYVQERSGVKKCAPIVSDMKITIKDNDYNFFDLAYLRYQLEMTENLLMDLEIYTKKILWFYGDNICAICSPKVQNYFEFAEGNPKLNVHINTCSERIEEREFERNLTLLYENFISKTMEFIQCTQGVNEEEEEGTDPDANKDQENKDSSDEKKHHDNFLPIDEEEKETFLNLFEECWNDQNVTNKSCQNFCVKNMRQYEFPIKNLFHNFKVSLKTMYETMVEGGDIEEYYMNIKEIEWSIEDENDPIDFFPKSDDWTKYKMDNIEWEFHTSTGHNVFKEIMSKKFTDVETSVARYAGLIFVALFAFLA